MNKLQDALLELIVDRQICADAAGLVYQGCDAFSVSWLAHLIV